MELIGLKSLKMRLMKPLKEWMLMSECSINSPYCSLPRSRFLDVTQRSPKETFGGALHDIQKTAARETTLTEMDKKSVLLHTALCKSVFQP